MKVPRTTVEVVKSQWGWTARLTASGREIAHAREKTLLLAYLAECGLR